MNDAGRYLPIKFARRGKPFAGVLLVCLGLLPGCGESSVAREEASAVTVDGVVLEPRVVLQGKVSLVIPEGFALMGEEMLSFKYPSERRPTVVYSNDAGSVNVAINYTENRVAPAQLKECHEAMDEMFHNLYPSAAWFESEVVSVDGRDWFFMHLRTPAIDTEVRNMISGTSMKGRLLLVTFNVTRELEDEWLSAGAAIVQSVRVSSESL